MKSTGVTRPLDQLGRIVIPMELRRTLKLNEGDKLQIFVEGEDIILRKYKVGCHCCGEMKGLTKVFDLDICPKCLVEFKKAAELIDKARKVK
ncbi:AbrB/MazE/SpoVT family DNA-binding domain-containing protein [Clostridium beijerinckii]|uniref:AbrB/MazE/SpoVT family DNA-binding domain-containing protein n=1 Tax=Clostridium beijerinckii TaxID=1520 RepID=UPI00047D2DB9|nr:AbrB/MazE/SpoVT family DNA-binding domain-containing protein [Clostridium beijerinckii]